MFLGANHTGQRIRSPKRFSGGNSVSEQQVLGKRMSSQQIIGKRLSGQRIWTIQPKKNNVFRRRSGRTRRLNNALYRRNMPGKFVGKPKKTFRYAPADNALTFTISDGIRGRVKNQKDVFRRLLFNNIKNDKFTATVMTFFESKNLEQLNMKQLSLSSEKMQKKFVKLVNQHCDDLISDRPFDNMKQQVNLLKLKAVEIGMFGINIGCFVIFQAQDFETFFGIELNESNDANFEVTGVHRKQILQNIYVFPPLKDDVARFDVIRIGDKNLIEKLSQNKFSENSIAAEHGMFVVISKNE